MSRERGNLGVFGALVAVLTILGLLALIADALGILPKF
jgi:hypothetical protein